MDAYNILTSVCNGFPKYRNTKIQKIIKYQKNRLADLTKRKPEIQLSHDCLWRTLRKDSNDSFNEVTRNFK